MIMKNIKLKSLLLIFICSITFISCEENQITESNSIESLNNLNSMNYHQQVPNYTNLVTSYYGGFMFINSFLNGEIQGIPMNKQLITDLAFKPFIQNVRYSLNMMGIPDEEIIENYGTLYSTDLIITGMYLLGDNPELHNGSMNRVSDCILEATGIMALKDAFFGNFTNRRAIVKAIGKVAGRTLGYVGTVIAAYDFMNCMGLFERVYQDDLLDFAIYNPNELIVLHQESAFERQLSKVEFVSELRNIDLQMIQYFLNN